jgi:uncharacterized protein
MSHPRYIGAGIGLRRAHVDALLARTDAAPAVLELSPSQFFAAAAEARLERIAEGRTIVLHDVFVSLATLGPLDLEHLDRVAAVVRRSRAIVYTEHLAMTRSPSGIDLGHLVPVPRTRAQLEVLVDQVRVVRDRLELPIALELATTTLIHPRQPGDLSEGEFVTELVERSGCELVLDLENLRIDAHNYADARPELAAEARLAALPLAAVSHLHLAGGHLVEELGGRAIDSHAHPVPEPTWALLASLRGRIDPRTIIVERDAALPSLDALLAEAARAETIWNG